MKELTLEVKKCIDTNERKNQKDFDVQILRHALSVTLDALDNATIDRGESYLKDSLRRFDKSVSK